MHSGVFVISGAILYCLAELAVSPLVADGVGWSVEYGEDFLGFSIKH